MKGTRSRHWSARSAVLALIILTNIGLSYHRNSIYGSTLTLWQDVATKNPKRARAHNNLGNAYLGLGMLPLAVEEYKRTIALDRYFVKAYYNLGMALESMGKPADAVYYYGVFCSKSPPDPYRPVACERYQVLTRNAGKEKRP